MTERYRIRSVTKRFGSNVAVAIDALTIEAGRLYTLTGANGAGKSTLLGILAFLTPPTTGEIFYAGERIDWKSDIVRKVRRNVTLLHQSPYLFGGTVFRNVAYGPKARGIAGDAALRSVDRALETVGLEGFRDRDARELSGGEAQRVAMARALATDPEVLLLDEPMANIDRESAVLLERVIASLPSRGATVVMTTHDPDPPAGRNAGSIALEGGKVVRLKPSGGSGSGARVAAVCVSGRKGERKKPVPSVALIADHGILGDAHAGDGHRQVSLLAAESIEKMRRKGLSVSAGDFAENVTTEGILLPELPVGSRFRIGEAVLEVTQIGKECHTRCAIYHQAGDCVMPREGIFARVVEPGKVSPGDAIERIDGG